LIFKKPSNNMLEMINGDFKKTIEEVLSNGKSLI
jgi:hypothetical protein